MHGANVARPAKSRFGRSVTDSMTSNIADYYRRALRQLVKVAAGQPE